MVEFIEDSESGSPEGTGEFELIAPSEFTGLSLQERWETVRTFIQSGFDPSTQADVDVPQQPELPGIDIDLSDLDQRGLLELLVETTRVQANTQISILSTLFDIYASVRESRGITIIGSEIIDQQDVAQEVISQDSPVDSAEGVLTRTLLIRASNENTAPIAFGDDQVKPQTAFMLHKGEMVTLNVDIGRLDLYMASEQPDQVVQLLGLR